MKFYIQLGAALAVGLIIMWGIGYVSRLQKEAAVGAVRGGVIETTSGVVTDGQKDDKDKVAVETGVTSGREEFKATIEEAKRNEPETVARSERPVPVSVRNAYRARRLARERSAGIESERGEEPSTSPPAQW